MHLLCEAVMQLETEAAQSELHHFERRGYWRTFCNGEDAIAHTTQTYSNISALYHREKYTVYTGC